MSDENKKPVAAENTGLIDGFRKDFGYRLKFLRKMQQMTQAETADGLGMNYRHYQDIEAGKSDLKVSSLIKIAGFFKLPIDELVDIGDKAPFTSPMEPVERFFREVGNLILAPLTLRDMNGVVLTANKAALAIGGFELKDVVGKTVLQLCPTEMIPFYEGILRNEQKGIFSPVVYHFISKAGERASVNYFPIPIVGKGGKPLAVIALLSSESIDFNAPT